MSSSDSSVDVCTQQHTPYTQLYARFSLIPVYCRECVHVIVRSDNHITQSDGFTCCLPHQEKTDREGDKNEEQKKVEQKGGYLDQRVGIRWFQYIRCKCACHKRLTIDALYFDIFALVVERSIVVWYT